MPRAAAVDVLVFIGGRQYYSTKVFVGDVEECGLSELALEVLTEYSRNCASAAPNDDDSLLIHAHMQRISSIKCKGVETTEMFSFLGNSNATLGVLDSVNTPFLKNGLVFHLTSDKGIITPKAPKVNPFNMMMGNGEKSALKFLEPPPTKSDPRLDDQIKSELVSYFTEAMKIGYFNPDQKKSLEKIISQLVVVLCAVQKHWHKLMSREFPAIPSKFGDCELLEVVSNCSRTSTKSSSEDLPINIVNYHLTTLASVNWSAFFKSKRMKAPIALMKSQIAELSSVLMERKTYLIGKRSVFAPTRSISNSFKELPSFVKLDEDVDEFFVAVLPNTKKSQKKSQRTAKSIAVENAIDSLTGVLRHKCDYSPVFLTDEHMGITDDAFYREGGTVGLCPADRAHYRYAFKKQLRNGLKSMSINIFGRNTSGRDAPSCIVVWKVPLAIGDEHVGNVQNAIKNSRLLIPKRINTEAALRLNNILRGISSVPRGVRKAMTNYLFAGEMNIEGDFADSYCQFVEHVSAGLPVDESWILDGRKYNSRGGRGIGHTTFQPFWDECRRHDDALFASNVLSIPDLVRRATESLTLKANASVPPTEVPPVPPSLELVRLQFVANNHTVSSATKLTGGLGVVRKAQTRTLRKLHIDQHWVNAYNRYVYEWLIELRLLTPYVEFYGQDDKAKIPIGDSVPISTGVCPNTRTSIVAPDSEALNACDHDFHVGNLTLSVALRCNIPKEIGGSFFIGDSEDGFGKLYYTLRDSIFDPSKVFDHTSQLAAVLERDGLSPFVLVLQTDGGPDHSIKFLTTKLALLALFLKLDLDQLLVLRGAPNGSAFNKIERGMSVVNGVLGNVSTKRGEMPEWAETIAKSCNSMNAIREAHVKTAKERETAIAYMKETRLRYAVRYLQSYVNRLVRQMCSEIVLEGDRMEAIVKAASMVTEICNLVLPWLGAPADECIQMGDVSGVIQTEEGQAEARSVTISQSVQMNKRKEGLEKVAHDFKEAWTDSVQKPIDAINSRMSRIVVSGRAVDVVPRVGSSVFEDSLRSILRSIDPRYDEKFTTAQHFDKMPAIKKFYDKHVVGTPYSLSFVKCEDPSCKCKPMRSPMSVRALALQRQPAPKLDRTDQNRTGHYLKRSDALRLSDGNEAAACDLSDLPSKVAHQESTEAGKAKTARDAAVTKELVLRSWENRRVRGTVICFHCNKARCLYSVTVEAFLGASGELKRTMESIDYRYSCGDLIFPDGHPTSKIIGQRINLTCESPIEKSYYNVEGRTGFLTTPICIHCGEKGGSDFLFQQAELESMNKSGGQRCYPICKLCLNAGKKIETYPRKKTNNTQKRTEDRANIAAEASKRRKKK
eukprot:scaffold53876_cov80-Cyclotella_meneghiniana.AAC.5